SVGVPLTGSVWVSVTVAAIQVPPSRATQPGLTHRIRHNRHYRLTPPARVLRSAPTGLPAEQGECVQSDTERARRYPTRSRSTLLPILLSRWLTLRTLYRQEGRGWNRKHPHDQYEAPPGRESIGVTRRRSSTMDLYRALMQSGHAVSHQHGLRVEK